MQQRRSVMDDLKGKAKELGLWNLFLAGSGEGHGTGGGGGIRGGVGKGTQGAGFSNVEYGLMAELLGKSRTASEVC